MAKNLNTCDLLKLINSEKNFERRKSNKILIIGDH